MKYAKIKKQYEKIDELIHYFFLDSYFFLTLPLNLVQAIKEWTQVNVDGFGDANNMGATTFETQNSELYVGTYNETTGSEVWLYYSQTQQEPIADNIAEEEDLGETELPETGMNTLNKKPTVAIIYLFVIFLSVFVTYRQKRLINKIISNRVH